MIQIFIVLDICLDINEGNKNKIINQKNTVVIGSPDTGIPGGIGFAEALNLKYEQFSKKIKIKVEVLLCLMIINE